jgi:hypothetical protein
VRRIEDGDTASSVLVAFFRVLDDVDTEVKAVYLNLEFYDVKFLMLSQAHKYGYVVPLFNG